MRYRFDRDVSDLDDIEVELRRAKFREEEWYEKHAKLPLFYEKKEGTCASVQKKADIPSEELLEIPNEHGENPHSCIGKYVSKFRFFNKESEEKVNATHLSVVRSIC